MSQLAYCPGCDSRIRFFASNTKVGTRVTCPECGQMLEVVRLRPLELDWAYDRSRNNGTLQRWRDDPVQVDFGYYDDNNTIDSDEW